MNIPAPILRSAKASWRHRWVGLAAAWLICLVGWAIVYTMPNQYQASARLYAEADVILGQALRGIAVDGAPQQQVELLTRTMLARPNLERVVARTDLDMRVDSARSREALLDGLAREIRVVPQARSLYQITYTDHDARVAQAVVRTLLDLFMERAASNDRQAMENARGFVNQQINTYETQLREAERRRAEFRARYLDLLPSDARGGASRLEDARRRLAELRGELEDAQARRDVLRQQIDALPAQRAVGGGGGDPRLAAAERDLRELRLRYTDQHPAVIAQRNIIAELRSSGGGGRGGGGGGGAVAPPSTQRDVLQARLVDVDLAIASTERQIASGTEEVERLETLARSAPQLQAEFDNLDRDYGVLRRQYEELLTRRESLQLAGAARTGADQVRIEVVEPPTVPTIPRGPNRLLFASAVLVVGLGAGGALAIMLGLLDRGFYSLRDLREIGLPVLGSVAEVDAPRRLVPAAAFAGAALLLVGTYGAMLIRGPELVAQGSRLVARLLA
jgi:polysaccharide chain length determinant protein (PEP-CTERM system associated)